MAQFRVSEAWKKKQLENIKVFQTSLNPEPMIIKSSFLPAIRWLILEWEEAGIPYKLISMGAGLKMLTTETDICPKCKGSGRV